MNQTPKVEELQEVWDTWLIKAWRADSSVGWLMVQIQDRLRELGYPHYGEKNLAACLRKDGVRRVADFMPFKRRVQPWVSEHLAWLNDRLWDGKLTDESLVKGLTGSEYDIKRDQTEARARHRLKVESQANVRSTKRAQESARSRNKTHWDQTKRVRSR